MNKLLIFLLSLCVTSLEAATITNWGAQLPTMVPASGDAILMQKGGVTYYFTPVQLATFISTNLSLGTSNAIPNLNGRGTNATFAATIGVATNLWQLLGTNGLPLVFVTSNQVMTVSNTLVLSARPQSTTTVPLTLIGSQGQDANLLNVKDYLGNVLFAISYDGTFSDPRLASPSSAGALWTATDDIGNGAWSTNLTPQNLSISNVIALKALVLNANKQVTNAATSSADLDNFFAMGITNVLGLGGIAIGTNNGKLWVTNTADIGNAKFWGAVGDGVTDNTAAIQLAVNSSAANRRSLHIDDRTLFTPTLLTNLNNFVLTMENLGQASPPLRQNLGSNFVMQYLEPNSPLALRTFIHRQNTDVPENELTVEAFYHPAYTVDNINPDAFGNVTNGPGAHMASFCFRNKGITHWLLNTLPNAATNDIDFAIREFELSPLIDATRFKLYADSTLQYGVGTLDKALITGNLKVVGFVKSEGANETTGRAALALRSFGGTETWIRLNGNNRTLEIATARDGGTSLWSIKQDGVLRFENGDLSLQASSGKVGMGTATPANALDVEGGMAIGVNYSGSIAAPTGGFIVEGGMGVGASVPTAKLHINAASSLGAAVMRLENSSQTSATWEFDIDVGSAAILGVKKNGDTGYAMAWEAGGNVGIGTTAPLDKLHVVGGIVQTNGGIWQTWSLGAPSAPATQGAVYWNDGTNICAVFRNSGGALSTNKLSMTAWP